MLLALKQLLPDRAHNLQRVFIHFMIPKPHHGDSFFRQPGGAFLIVCRLTRLSVPATIYLNCQSSLIAIEIQNITHRWMLSTEFIASQPSIAQQTP